MISADIIERMKNNDPEVTFLEILKSDKAKSMELMYIVYR